MAHKILTVDDSRTIRMIVKKAFKPYECELFEGENGVEGLALASKIKPDLIVLDITMPVMTGVEMLNKLKEEDELKEIPVIMLTAESGKDNVMKIVKMGVKDYVVKPFKGEQLIERARKILNLKPRIDHDDEKERHVSGSGGNYFSVDEDVVILELPQKVTRSVGANVESSVKEKISKMTSVGANKFVIDLTEVANVNMIAIQLIISVINSCARAKLNVRLVASASQTDALKGFQETSSLPTDQSVEDAKNTF